MLIFLKKQRDETIKLILNLQKKLNVKNKYETTMKNNNRLITKIDHVKNQINQRKLFILKKTRLMQWQQRLNVLKINNVEIEKIKRFQKNEIEKSRFFNVFVNMRRNDHNFQFFVFTNFFFIHDIIIIIVNEFVNDNKKFNKFFSFDKFIDKFNCELTFFD